VCEYCGCRDIPLIGRLSEEHYQAVDALGVLRRAIEADDAAGVTDALRHLRAELITHNESEEAGLFHELAKDDYFAPTVAELIGQHGLFRVLLGRLDGGDWSAYGELEETLRHHIDREENGFFPATAVAVDGDVWEEIDRLTHAFNHAHHREHAHTEAELLELARSRPVITEPDEAYALRRATVADAAELLSLWRQAGLAIRRPDAVAAELASVTALHPDLVLVAVTGDSIVGSVVGTWDGRRGWVSRLATRRDWRGRGVAGALLTAVEDGVRALGGTEVALAIDADDYPLVGFYEGHGYATADLIFLEKPL
jgi:ribosomal protein S18 acetylase RimI-like enzyme